MPPLVATLVFIVGILGLFWLDRDSETRPSVALWIPVIWLAIVCSRPVGQWLQLGTPVDTVSATMEGSPVDRLVYSFLLALGLVVLISRRKVVGLMRANGPILLFYIYGAVSIFWSDFPEIALKRWPKALGDVVMVLVILTDAQPLAAFKRVLSRLSFVLIPLSILFIKYTPQLGMGWNPWTGAAIFTGVTTNKNTLGVICLCLGLGTLWRFITTYQDREAGGRTRQLIAHGVVLLMVLYLFQKADSMTSLSCFLMAGVLLLVAKSRAAIRRPALVHVVLVSMVVVSAAILFIGASPEVLRALGRNPTLTDRTVIWSEMLTQVRNPIFGTGFDSFWLGPRLQAIWRMNPVLRPNEAHNGYLEVFLNLGWMGVALLAFNLVAGYRSVFKIWRSSDPRGALFVAFFFMGLVYNFTEAAFFKMQAAAWIFFLFAMAKAGETVHQEIPFTATADFQETLKATEWNLALPPLNNRLR